MQTALMATVSMLVVIAPWYFLICSFILPFRKAKVRTFLGVYGLTLLGFSIFSYVFLDISVQQNRPVWEWLIPYNIILLTLCGIIFAEACFMSRLQFSKMLYILLMLVSLAALANTAAYDLERLFFPGKEAYGFASGWSYPVICVAVLIILIPLISRLFKKNVRRAFNEVPSRQFYQLCAIPVLFIVLIFTYNFLLTYYEYTIFASLWMILLIGMTGIATYALTLRMILDGMKYACGEAAVASMERQLILQAQHYELLTENIEQARRARHDLRHHLSALLGLAEKNDFTNMIIYLKNYLDTIPEELEKSVCENSIVDSVSRYYLAIAREVDAELDIKISLPSNIAIADADLCIVFGNLLENAVESVTRQESGRKYIRCRCQADNEKMVLTVDNSTDDTNDAQEGIGLGSVFAVAEKYCGKAKFERHDGVYLSSVLLTYRRQ